ncbi:MAG: HNH endonuclease signature motif containing protein [Planctomycetota bacterium]|nr:HNH endonuclease signature motif containing protein [Planctomycetota bacterium]
MADARPPIPMPVQREIRQRCGFGCVVCGCPLYEYHHMVRYDESKPHVADEITLLCDRHHKESTNLLLTVGQITAANANPSNVENGISSPYALHFEGDACTCVIGQNRFTSALRDVNNVAILIPISIDDTDLLYFTIDPEGNLFLDATILDECNSPLLIIVENRLAYRTQTWDIDFRGSTLTVREAARKIFFEITFEPPSQITISRARLLCNGVELLVRKGHIFVVNSGTLYVGNSFENCPAGIIIGRNQRQLRCAVRVKPEIVKRNYMPRKEVIQRERKVLRRRRGSLADTKEILGALGSSLDEAT